MYPLVAAYESGELSVRRICSDLEMSQPGFWYWLKKYRSEKAGEGDFIEINLPEQADIGYLEVKLGDATIRFAAIPDANYLRSLALGC